MRSATNARALTPRKRLSMGARKAPLMQMTQVMKSGAAMSQAQPPAIMATSARTIATTFHSKVSGRNAASEDDGS